MPTPEICCFNEATQATNRPQTGEFDQTNHDRFCFHILWKSWISLAAKFPLPNHLEWIPAQAGFRSVGDWSRCFGFKHQVEVRCVRVTHGIKRGQVCTNASARICHMSYDVLWCRLSWKLDTWRRDCSQVSVTRSASRIVTELKHFFFQMRRGVCTKIKRGKSPEICSERLLHAMCVFSRLAPSQTLSLVWLNGAQVFTPVKFSCIYKSPTSNLVSHQAPPIGNTPVVNLMAASLTLVEQCDHSLNSKAQKQFCLHKL